MLHPAGRGESSPPPAEHRVYSQLLSSVHAALDDQQHDRSGGQQAPATYRIVVPMGGWELGAGIVVHANHIEELTLVIRIAIVVLVFGIDLALLINHNFDNSIQLSPA